MGDQMSMAEAAKILEYFKVCNCCGEHFATGQHYLNSVDILPRGIDFQKGFLWANCICGSTHLVKLDLYPDHIKSYLRFLVTYFKDKYASEVSGTDGGELAVEGEDVENGDDTSAGPTYPDA